MRRRLSRALAALLAGALVAALALGIARLAPREPFAARYGSSVAFFDADGTLLRLTTARDDRYRLWTPLSAIQPELVEAFLLHEDRHFFDHPGVNPVALTRGAFRTYVAGQPPQGGSTITMQLARVAYRMNTRSLRGKLAQVGAALWIEARYSKREILEAYLNLVPFGANIEGVGAASLVYFGKRPDALALAEALALAVIPQSPARRMLTRADRDSLEGARRRLAARWQAAHALTPEQSSLLALPLALKGPAALPFRAPHLTTMLAAQQTPGSSAHVRTTLDAPLQTAAERITRQYLARTRAQGVRNGAVMIVDTRTMAVRALVGSADFGDPAIQGQVNGTLARRSPGSTLKPFVYALAFDQGLAHPMTVLADAPAAFGTFSPENFDGGFLGPITVQDALVRSRNVPAVAVASRLASPTLHQFLRSAGVQRLADESRYGLAIALGAAELSMQELVTLYAMLANDGKLRPLRFRADDPPPGDGVALLTPEASWMTLEMLRANPRPDGMSGASGRTARAVAAWKTGTSWGFRDAWSIGVIGPYVVAVWIGNFDGAANPAFVGGRIAAPLFFQLADALDARAASGFERRAPPAGLARVEVCAASGDLPNAECPRTVPTWFVPGRSPIRVSTIHRSVAIDTRTGRRACAGVDPRFVRTAVYEFWPSDLARVLALAGVPRATPPEDCIDGAGPEPAGAPPAIVSPLVAASYVLRPGRDESIALAARADGGARTLYWFVDDRFVGAAAPQTPLNWPLTRPGRYTVRVVDDRGRADSRRLAVSVAD